MESGMITLGQVESRTEVLAVACTRCDRVGSHPVATLIRRFGPEFTIPDLLRVLSQGCPISESAGATDPCGIHCTDLANLFRR